LLELVCFPFQQLGSLCSRVVVLYLDLIKTVVGIFFYEKDSCRDRAEGCTRQKGNHQKGSLLRVRGATNLEANKPDEDPDALLNQCSFMIALPPCRTLALLQLALQEQIQARITKFFPGLIQ
jgi:hypothetical protein